MALFKKERQNIFRKEAKTMKDTSSSILPIASFVFMLTAIAGLINKLFDTHIGLYETEVPSDPLIITVLFVIGLVCLLPILLRLLRNRSAVK
jgi:hypothetical protein